MLTSKEKRGLIIGAVVGGGFLVAAVIAAVVVVVIMRKRSHASKGLIPLPLGIPKILANDINDGKNSSSLPTPKQSNKTPPLLVSSTSSKTTSIPTTPVPPPTTPPQPSSSSSSSPAVVVKLPDSCAGVSTDVVDSWKGTPVVVSTEFFRGEVIKGNFGKFIPSTHRGKHECNQFFAQSDLGPLHLVARQNLLSVTVSFNATFYIYTYLIDNQVSINPQLFVSKLVGGKEAVSAIVTSQPTNALITPLGSPPLAQKVDIGLITTVTKSDATNTAISFEKDDVLVIQFGIGQSMLYTPYTGSVSIQAVTE